MRIDGRTDHRAQGEAPGGDRVVVGLPDRREAAYVGRRRSRARAASASTSVTSSGSSTSHTSTWASKVISEPARDRVEVHQCRSTRHGRDQDEPSRRTGRRGRCRRRRSPRARARPCGRRQEGGKRRRHPGRCDLARGRSPGGPGRGGGRPATDRCSGVITACSSSVAFQSSAEVPQSTGRPSTRRSLRSTDAVDADPLGGDELDRRQPAAVDAHRVVRDEPGRAARRGIAPSGIVLRTPVAVVTTRPSRSSESSPTMSLEVSPGPVCTVSDDRDPVSVTGGARREVRSRATRRWSVLHAGRRRPGGIASGSTARVLLGDHDGRRPATGRRPRPTAPRVRRPGRGLSRRSTTGAPASCSLALARLRSPTTSASTEKTASALATVTTTTTARVSRRRPISSRVTPATRLSPPQQPTARARSPRVRRAWASEQTDEQCQQRRPGQGEGAR